MIDILESGKLQKIDQNFELEAGGVNFGNFFASSGTGLGSWGQILEGLANLLHCYLLNFRNLANFEDFWSLRKSVGGQAAAREGRAEEGGGQGSKAGRVRWARRAVRADRAGAGRADRAD